MVGPAGLKSAFLAIIMSGGFGGFSPAAGAMTLQEALISTFERNPKMQANEKRLEEVRLHARAAWEDLWPTVSVNYSVYQGRGRYKVDGETFGPYSERMRNGSAGIGVEIFNPGAAARARAADVEVQMQTAIYNSTQPFIENTKGALASEVQETYTAILMFRQLTGLTDELLSIMNVFAAGAGTVEEKNRIQESINSLRASRVGLEVPLRTFLRNFNYLVTVDAPENLSSFDEVIDSLRIPETSEEAATIGMANSPNLKVKAFAIERARHIYDAKWAETWLPRVYLSISSDHNRSSMMGQQMTTGGPSAMVSFRWSFSVSDRTRLEASRVSQDAAELDLQGLERDLKHKLANLYQKYKGYARKDGLLLSNLEEVRTNMDAFLRRMVRGEDVDLVKDGLVLAQNLSNATREVIDNKNQIVDTKFEIQKSIGTLFEDANLHVFGNSHGRGPN